MAQPWDVSDQSPESIGVTLPGPVLLGFDSGLELSPHSYSSSYSRWCESWRKVFSEVHQLSSISSGDVTLPFFI